MNKHKELVKSFIIENFLFGDERKLKDDTDFFSTGIIDSTGILELVGFIESSLPVKVNDDELVIKNFSSLNNIIAYLKLKLNSD
jgi:acyl carrier protein